MIRIVAGVLLVLSASAVSAAAQAPKIFVASTGSDSNDGGRATPKRSFQAAQDAVDPGGEIVVLDTAGYGPVTISKSLHIVVPSGVTGFVTTTNGNGVTVSASKVSLRGLVVECTNILSCSTGILVTGGNVVVEDTIVQNFQTGILLNSASSSYLEVKRSAVRYGEYGIYVQDAGGNTKINGAVWDTEITGVSNAFGAFRNYSGSSVTLVTTRCSVLKATNAFLTNTGGSSLIVDGCTATSNSSVFSPGGGTIYTRSNNTFVDNSAIGATPTPIAAQ